MKMASTPAAAMRPSPADTRPSTCGRDSVVTSRHAMRRFVDLNPRSSKLQAKRGSAQEEAPLQHQQQG
jgi:hypothetical protein